MTNDEIKAMQDVVAMAAIKATVESIGSVLKDELIKKCTELGIEVEAEFNINVLSVNPDVFKANSKRRRK